MSTYNAFYSCLSLGEVYRDQPYSCNYSNSFLSTCRSLFWFSYGCLFIGLLTTVAVASLVEIIYHVKLVRKDRSQYFF